jgi:predicted GNAT superfamily acetyltransferase
MDDHNLSIRNLEAASEMSAAVTVFQQVWGSATPLVGVELLCAIAHSGGYVAAAYDAGNIIGASFGFLARHHGDDALHSHVTGILPGVQHSGIGRTMKNHQREWAAERNLTWVTWTFDPLVRRNAWFNIEVLGAQVADYLVDFYGPMTDALNSNDETDRLLIAWPVRGDEPSPHPTAASTSTTTDELIRVPTPDDVVILRRTDPRAAAAWRHRVRNELGGPLAAGGSVVGFTREGDYLVRGAP